MRRSQLLTRGALAVTAGCHIETIRYYEKIGILPPPPRSAAGHRLYGHELVKRLHFVRRSRDLRFTLEEIRQLLRLVDGGNYTCEQVESVAREHVRDIRGKIADLKRLKDVLEALASRCNGRRIPECPFIEALFDPRTPLPSPRAVLGRSRPPRNR